VVVDVSGYFSDNAGLDRPAAREEERWAWEPKWDGWRVHLWGEDGQVRVITRAGHDVTSLFLELDTLGAVELAIGRVRDQLLNVEEFGTLTEARVLTEALYLSLSAIHLLPYLRGGEHALTANRQPRCACHGRILLPCCSQPNPPQCVPMMRRRPPTARAMPETIVLSVANLNAGTCAAASQTPASNMSRKPTSAKRTPV
jgi:hypothetical protein